MPDRPRIVVLGGGFGGVGAVKKLGDVDADVLLVDKHDYHTFQPLLYQVATDLLEPPTVGHPLRDLFHDRPNVKVKQATVTGIDLDKRRVSFAEMKPVSYDYLVLGLGATVNFFGVAGAPKHAFPMVTNQRSVVAPDPRSIRREPLVRGGSFPGPPAERRSKNSSMGSLTDASTRAGRPPAGRTSIWNPRVRARPSCRRHEMSRARGLRAACSSGSGDAGHGRGGFDRAAT